MSAWRPIHPALYRELLRTSRRLAKLAGAVPHHFQAHVRVLEKQRGWHARCFPRPFTLAERAYMAETTGLAPAAQVEHLVKAAFATRWSPALSGLYDTLISCSGTLILEHEPCKSILRVKAA